MTLQLENYGVSELSHSEQRETDGGIGIIDDIIIGVVAGAVISIMDNWGDIREGWADGKTGKPRH